jgi:glycosyltransferase involved in cell wall biosynthesis
LKILFVQEQPCIRSFKYAKGLLSLTDELELSFAYRGKTLNGIYGHGDELFEDWFRIEGDLISSIEKIAGRFSPDIIHCHNGPDTLTVAAIQALGGSVPVIHDIHDLLSLRTTIYDDGLDRGALDRDRTLEEERLAIEESDGVIAVSPAILEIARDRYELTDNRQLVFPNLVVREMVPAFLGRKLSEADGQIHLVYEGHLDQGRSGGHYDLFDIFKAIASHGLNIHIYPSWDNGLYRKLSEENDLIHYHESLRTIELMSELTRYDFGWAGFNTTRNKTHADTVLANKMVEYLAAGIPVVSFPHRSQKKFIEEHGVGIIIEQVNELPGKIETPSVADLKSRVIEKRFSFTVENSIENVVKFYQKIARGSQARQQQTAQKRRYR